MFWTITYNMWCVWKRIQYSTEAAERAAIVRALSELVKSAGYIYLDEYPIFKPKWTKANSGKAKLQGISPEAMIQFVNYCKRMCNQACKNK